MLETILLTIHVAASIAIITLVLMQHGKGADAGAAFGAGASQTVFGSQGSGSFLSRSTGILAAIFFSTSLSLAYLAGSAVEVKSVTETVMPSAPAAVIESDVPVVPGQGDTADSDVPSVPTENAPAESDVPVVNQEQ